MNTSPVCFPHFILFCLSLPLQGFRGLVASMESAIQATREFLGNQDRRGIPANGAIQGSLGFVMFPCAIRCTTSGNITARGPTSDDTAVRETLLST